MDSKKLEIHQKIESDAERGWKIIEAGEQKNQRGRGFNELEWYRYE